MENNINDIQIEIERLEAKMTSSDFWVDKNKAQEIIKK